MHVRLIQGFSGLLREGGAGRALSCRHPSCLSSHFRVPSATENVASPWCSVAPTDSTGRYPPLCARPRSIGVPFHTYIDCCGLMPRCCSCWRPWTHISYLVSLKPRTATQKRFAVRFLPAVQQLSRFASPSLYSRNLARRNFRGVSGESRNPHTALFTPAHHLTANVWRGLITPFEVANPSGARIARKSLSPRFNPALESLPKFLRASSIRYPFCPPESLVRFAIKDLRRVGPPSV